MAYIYCITNNVNGKQYVGKTICSIDKRFKEHCKECWKERCEKRPLYDAMQKYGLENFNIILLQECDELELSSYEILWINKLNSYKNGYNATLGGDGSILFDYKLIISEYEKLKSVKEVSLKIGCCGTTVGKVLQLYGIDSKINADLSKSKQILQYNLQEEYVQSFVSTMEAINWLYENKYTKTASTGNSSHLGKCANGKAKTAYKFIWKWAN